MIRMCLLGFVLLTAISTVSHGDVATWQPDQHHLPTEPPQGAVMLLDLEGNHQFVSMTGGEINWPTSNGALVSTQARGNVNHIVSKLHFRDADIHVEFMTPANGAGNSGLYIHGNYELQIINSYGKEKLTQEMIGSLYGFAPPRVNAGRKPEVWQVYDIRYQAPRRDKTEQIIEKGSVTAWLNGQLVQENTTFGEPRSTYHPYRHGTTPYLQTIWKRQKATMTGPLFLQDHNARVKFRNVWIVPQDEQAAFYSPSAE